MATLDDTLSVLARLKAQKRLERTIRQAALETLSLLRGQYVPQAVCSAAGKTGVGLFD